jgi:hypothetical protein
LFALIGRVVTDPAIKLHFLPAHGMALSATAMAYATNGTFQGRKLEISGWTEFDGEMCLPQSGLRAVDSMNQTLAGLPADALYAIQWRVTSTTFDNAFFCHSQWDADLAPPKFGASLAPLFGIQGTAFMRQGMEKLKAAKVSAGGFGFCYYGCWQALLAVERSEEQPLKLGPPDGFRERKEKLANVQRLIDQVGRISPSRDGRRLADYFANKLRCGGIHMDYWAELARASLDGSAASPDESAALAGVAPYATGMLDFARQYLRTYQEYMLDRTDEGILASYWLVAGRYAYRYARPQECKAVFDPGRALSAPQLDSTRIVATN